MDGKIVSAFLVGAVVASGDRLRGRAAGAKALRGDRAADSAA